MVTFRCIAMRTFSSIRIPPQLSIAGSTRLPQAGRLQS
jgi:hypothetical protein